MNAVKIAGYAAFFLVSLLLSIYLTFPWDAAKDRLLDVASQYAGGQVTAEKLEPSWFTGFTATKVRYKPPEAEAPIEIDEVNARIKLLALLSGAVGVSAEVPIAKGTVSADLVASDPELDLDATISHVELALVPGLSDGIGLPLGGKIDLVGKIHLDSKTPKNTQGELDLKAVGLEILKGGKVSGFPVPELAIGDFNWKIPIKDGKATFDKQEVKGENVELKLDGTIDILGQLDRSLLKLFISFKPTDAFLKKEPILNALLQNINRAKGADGFYTYSVNGSVKHPRFAPARR